MQRVPRTSRLTTHRVLHTSRLTTHRAHARLHMTTHRVLHTSASDDSRVPRTSASYDAMYGVIKISSSRRYKPFGKRYLYNPVNTSVAQDVRGVTGYA